MWYPRSRVVLAFCLIFLCLLARFAASAEASRPVHFRTLINYDGSNGSSPVYPRLVQARDGNLYGTTLSGGTNSAGTVFRITPQGLLTTMYSFCSQANCADGALPYGGLVMSNDGSFYGTTSQGGSGG